MKEKEEESDVRENVVTGDINEEKLMRRN